MHTQLLSHFAVWEEFASKGAGVCCQGPSCSLFSHSLLNERRPELSGPLPQNEGKMHRNVKLCRIWLATISITKLEKSLRRAQPALILIEPPDPRAQIGWIMIFVCRKRLCYPHEFEYVQTQCYETQDFNADFQLKLICRILLDYRRSRYCPCYSCWRQQHPRQFPPRTPMMQELSLQQGADGAVSLRKRRQWLLGWSYLTLLLLLLW
jgi:hypothetical protein